MFVYLPAVDHMERTSYTIWRPVNTTEYRMKTGTSSPKAIDNSTLCQNYVALFVWFTPQFSFFKLDWFVNFCTCTWYTVAIAPWTQTSTKRKTQFLPAVSRLPVYRESFVKVT